MKTRAALIVAVLGTAASAYAQDTQGTFTYTLNYAVVTPTGPASAPWLTAAVGPTLTSGAIVNQGQALLIRIEPGEKCRCLS